MNKTKRPNTISEADGQSEQLGEAGKHDLWPPVTRWVEECCARFPSNLNLEVFLEELDIFGVNLYSLKEHRLTETQKANQSDNQKSLARVRTAIKTINEDLPGLIKSAEIELGRSPLAAETNPVPEELIRILENQKNKAIETLAVERLLLKLAQQFEKIAFYSGVTPGQPSREWADHAVLLFALLSRLFQKAGMDAPKQASVSRQTPLVKIIHKSLEWIGHANLSLETVAQCLKRDTKKQGGISVHDGSPIYLPRLALLKKGEDKT